MLRDVRSWRGHRPAIGDRARARRLLRVARSACSESGSSRAGAHSEPSARRFARRSTPRGIPREIQEARGVRRPWPPAPRPRHRGGSDRALRARPGATIARAPQIECARRGDRRPVRPPLATPVGPRAPLPPPAGDPRPSAVEAGEAPLISSATARSGPFRIDGGPFCRLRLLRLT
jgi:hypothetical protein